MKGPEPIRPWLNVKMRPLNLTEEEKGGLLQFLESLTGEVPEWVNRAPQLPASKP